MGPRLFPNWKKDIGKALVVVLSLFGAVSQARLGLPGSDGTDNTHNTQPRAALVALVDEGQLASILDSIQQLEKAFNSRYQYDWIFFSHGDLSEEFMSTISNATSAVTFYEEIPHTHWSVPGWIDMQRFEATLEYRHGSDVGLHTNANGLSDSHHMYRWSSGLFAREDRLRDYDWFWKVEPGSQFPEEIDFDVFQLLRDHGMVYGFSKTIRDCRSGSCSSFKSLECPAFGADVSDTSDTSAGYGPHRPPKDLKASQGPRTKSSTPTNLAIFDGETAYTESNLVQNLGGDSIEPATNWVLEKLFGMCTPGSNFELGSLGFFRGAQYSQYFDMLDSSGEFYYSDTHDNALRTPSASQLLAGNANSPDEDDEVECGDDFNPCEAGRGYRHEAPAANPTPRHELVKSPQYKPDLSGRHDNGDTRVYSFFLLLGNPDEDVPAKHKKWEQMNRDFVRQGQIPSLLSGHTVIDERNFVQILDHKQPRECIISLDTSIIIAGRV